MAPSLFFMGYCIIHGMNRFILKTPWVKVGWAILWICTGVYCLVYIAQGALQARQ